MRRIFVFCMIFTPTVTLHPGLTAATWQTPIEHRADSLLRLTRQAQDDSVRFERLLELSYFWSDWDTTRAFSYMRDAEALFPEATAFRKGQLLFNEAGIIYDNDIPRAKRLYKEADRYFSKRETPGAFLYRSRLWNNYGVLLQRQDSADRYLNIIIEKSLPFARKSGSQTHISANLVNIGLVLMNITDYHKARSYYDEAISVLSGLPDAHEERITAFTNAARNAIFLRDFPAARRYLDSAAAEGVLIPHSSFMPEYYGVEGQYYRHLKDRRQSKKYYEQGIGLARKLNDAYNVSALNFELYALYRDFGDYRAARKMLKATDESVEHLTERNRLLILNEWAALEYRTGNYRAAYDSLKVFSSLLDSLHKRELGLKVLELENKYRSMEKENELLKLREEGLRQQQTITRNRWVVYGLLAALAVLSWITYLVWRMNIQKKRLYEEELKTLEHREQERQFRSILEGQEKERNRIARDLHDGLGGMLAGVKLKLSSILSQTAAIPAGMQDVVRQLDQSSHELRRVARNMMPVSLLAMGLAPALADLCKMMETVESKITFQAIDMKGKYPDHLSVSIYRIVQELLANAVKHSGAERILVQCMDVDHRLYITVEDNGVGFDRGEAGKKGLGLTNVKSRVSVLRGTLEIIASPSEGAVFNIEVPLADEYAPN